MLWELFSRPAFRSFGAFIVLACLSARPAQAVILFNLDNSANTTAPTSGAASGLPWDSVGKITDVTGTAVAPSSVYIGNGYMLTANHVDISSGYVSLGGAVYAIDTSFAAVQVAANVDLKVFKLQVIPSVAAVNLLSTPTESGGNSYLVGWGLGRNPSEALGDTSVVWGDNSTAVERWGVNQIKAAGSLSYSAAGGPYTNDVLETFLGTPGGGGVGDAEAAATANDSGSGLFQKIGSVWYLVGLTTVVEVNGTSNFGNDPQTSASNGDVNGFVRISSYYSQIMTVVPEPETYALMVLGLGFVAFSFRARLRRSTKPN